MLLRYNFLLSTGLRVFDFFIVNLALFISGFFIDNTTISLQYQVQVTTFLVFNFAWVILESLTNYYKSNLYFIPVTNKTFNILILHFSVIIMWYFLQKEIIHTRLSLVYFYIYSFIGLLAPRYFIIFLHKKFDLFKYSASSF